MCCRCDIDVIPVWYVFDTDDISMMRYRCDADVITCDIDAMPVWYSCDTDVLSLLLLWYRCDTDVIHMWYRCGMLCCCDADVIPMRFRCDYTVSSMTSMCGPMLRHVEPPAPPTSLSPVGWSYRYICVYWRLGGESNREIDFGFVFVYVSCVRAKLCARILLQLGSAKLFSPTAAPAVGGRASRDVPGRPGTSRPLFSLVFKSTIYF